MLHRWIPTIIRYPVALWWGTKNSLLDKKKQFICKQYEREQGGHNIDFYHHFSNNNKDDHNGQYFVEILMKQNFMVMCK